jgi:hypothetical protein
VDALVVLVLKQGQNRVSNERKVKVEGKVQKRDREGVEDYQRLVMLFVTVAARWLWVWAAWRRALLGFWG